MSEFHKYSILHIQFENFWLFEQSKAANFGKQTNINTRIMETNYEP